MDVPWCQRIFGQSPRDEDNKWGVPHVLKELLDIYIPLILIGDVDEKCFQLITP